MVVKSFILRVRGFTGRMETKFKFGAKINNCFFSKNAFVAQTRTKKSVNFKICHKNKVDRMSVVLYYFYEQG